MAGAVTFLTSQIGGLSSSDKTPPPFTGNPLRLCVHDAGLFMKNVVSIPGVLLPWNQWPCEELDELYLWSPSNLICLALHFFLIILQSIFLLSLPLCVVFPLGWFLLYLIAFHFLNSGVSWILNGSSNSVKSNVIIEKKAKHQEECWIFLNGVAVGRHWLQGNVNRLALTFRRPIIGVHNRTYGVLFDLIQCIIERNFCYPTDDTRHSYALIKEALLNTKFKKVVLILHSQGGIEGALILDWLLGEVPQDLLQQLEIYTFGNASNHFNNPHRSYSSMRTAEQRKGSNPKDKAVRHIEHYASSGDFVACWGVLSFYSMKNRYMGRVFTRNGRGHLLNQHYLNDMFPLGPGPDRRVLEDNDFMNADVKIAEDAEDLREDIESSARWSNDESMAVIGDVNSPMSPTAIVSIGSAVTPDRVPHPPRVKDFSRLWLYRNGGSPLN